MNVIVQENKKLTKIVVQECDKSKDIDILLKALSDKKAVEVSFLNIKILKKEIVLKLQKNKERVKIITNELMLKNYLMNLGFELTFIDNYKKKKVNNLNLQYLAIGGSAGSLDKCIDIINSLPESNLSVFVVTHQKAEQKSFLANILQQYTKHYKVLTAKSDMKIEASTVYVAPPNKHMIIAGGFIFLTDSKKRNFSRPSISNTFESLSNEYKNLLLCVFVCGYGKDGSDSLQILRDNQSTVIVEDEKECEAKMMLQCVKDTGYYDDILTIEGINKFINSHINKTFFNDEDVESFLKKLNKKYGYDYRGYSFKHIKRRIDLFYSRLGVISFKEFEQRVLNDKNVFKDLFLNLSVNITTFYRNPELFKYLKDIVLPKLDSFVDIKIWCAGCSSGEEPYSLAILLKELGLYDKSTIYATDINADILKSAKNALYSKDDYNRFLKHYYKAGGSESFSSYFINHDNFVEVKDEVRENILFFNHNLTKGGKLNDFQLIFCRNVMIYFDKNLKAEVFDLFYNSLDSYGFLVLGESESLKGHQKYIEIDEKNKIYKRKK